MTDEEVHKSIERHDRWLQEMEDAQKAHIASMIAFDKRLERWDERMAGFHDSTTAFLIEMEILQRKNAEGIAELVQSGKATAEMNKATDERLASLAILMDQLIKRDLNGGKG